MIEYQKAEDMVLTEYPNFQVFSSVKFKDLYVFVLQNKIVPDPFPMTRVSVNRNTGEISDFFPSDPDEYNQIIKTNIIKAPKR